MNGRRCAIFVFAIKNYQYVYTYTHQVVANTFHRLLQQQFGWHESKLHRQSNGSKHANLN